MSQDGNPELATEKPPALAVTINKIDDALGTLELAIATSCLAILILAGAYQAIATNFLSSGAQWPYDLIHNSLFLIAAAGAAFAAHKHQQISMDVLSQRLSRRNRAYVELVIAAFVIVMCAVLVYRGLDVYAAVTSTEMETELVPMWVRAATFPGAAALIAVHYVLHAVVSIAYLTAGQVPPSPDEVSLH